MSAPMPPTYSQDEVANKMRKSAGWFYEHRDALLAQGMPPPMQQPGQLRWPRDVIDAWIKKAAGHA